MSDPERRNFIPWAEPRFWGHEERYALEALRSSWISGGPFVDRLESDLQRVTGSPHVVTTSNGTTAIQAAFLGVGLQPGDEVIVPGFAFMAAANICIHMGATPVFADVDPQTWCISAETVAEAITPRTKGIVPVHTYGNVCDMDPLLALAAEHGLWVIEDAAEAFGSLYKGRQAGTCAELGTYSFHATKTITSGEGGAVAARSDEAADKMRLYRSHGVRSRRYFHDVAGHNFRLTNIAAALAVAQLEQLEQIASERRRVYDDYRAAFASAPGLQLQVMTPGVEPLMWVVATRLDPHVYPQGRDVVCEHMAQHGIETRPGFYSASHMPHLYHTRPLAVSHGLAEQIICLPSSPTVGTAEVGRIVTALCAAARQHA